MKVVYKIEENYNSRRYSKPWIARVTSWEIGKHPVLNFGASQENYAEVDAEIGAVVFYGQKDNRNLAKSTKIFAVVGEDGELTTVTRERAADIVRGVEA